MADKYANFADLARVEASDAYAIRLRNMGSHVVIAAPHGGAIEPGTSEIAIALASEDLSYYLFEGRKPSANSELHITSSNFDEPHCLQLVTTAIVVLAIHGEARNDPVVFLGGRNVDLAATMGETLTGAGFVVDTHANPALQGRDPSNIVNRGLARAGVQLEISRGLRKQFFVSLQSAGRAQSTHLLEQFTLAVRGALRSSGFLPVYPADN
ncbi:MAG: poly-gamma-glutamate hydrolase family protein [Betaproteobacteria bacterium]|nr:poly-gamma-glutamate hydrolase family protein [Betaproteobacteria bacterium]